jgi:ligand-binding SRPBCC domain-containing protein
MLPPFRLGLGGRLGGGRQFMPWIHLHDLVGIVAAAIADERYRGPVNGSGPTPVRNREFTEALAGALRRPAIVPVPAFALKLAFGDSAQVLLASQRAEPKRLEALGFRFCFPTLAEALDDVLRLGPAEISPLPPGIETPAGSGTTSGRPRYLLRAVTTLDEPPNEVFAFFSEPANLGLLTPAAMRFRIEGESPALREGATIDYTLRVGPFPITWRTRIERLVPGSAFIDSQERGPYASWWHEHRFRAVGDRTVMEDCVYYAPPLGILGRLANRLFIAAQLRAIFAYRSDVIRLRFGEVVDDSLPGHAIGRSV